MRSGLDTPPASALDLLLWLGSWPSGRFSGCIEGMLRSESFFTLLNSLKCRWSPMELSPFLSVSVREKNHFMECQWRRMANFWRRWESERFWFKMYIFYIQINSMRSGLDTPPASALDLLLSLGSWPSGRFSGCIEGMLDNVQFLSLTPYPKRETYLCWETGIQRFYIYFVYTYSLV